MKKWCLIITFIVTCMFCSCESKDQQADRLRDIDFTVVTKDDIPEELFIDLEERKGEPFTITYADENALYICVGYGEQITGGFSISVDELYLTDEAIFIDTTLHGPTPEEAGSQAASYPYIVIETEFIEKSVIFK